MAAASLLLLTAQAGAAEPPPDAVPRAALLGLAKQFVDKVSAGFERADDYLMSPEEKRKKLYAVDIPDGELLLLKLGVKREGDRNKRRHLKFDEPVVAIKQGDDVMVSLSDFFHVAQFAIEVKPADGIAEGWYIKKNQTFRLDAKALTAKVQGKEFKLSEGDVSVEETDILVRSKVLENLFDFESEVYLASQFMDVVSKQKWPALEKLERLHREGRKYLPPPVLPRQDIPYRYADVPNAYISTSRGFKRDGDGNIGHSASYRIETDGDLLGHTARILASGSFDPRLKKVDSARAVFGRKSEKPDLLGWMGAHEYEFGDVNGGVGIRATNRNPYTTSDPTTVIEGDMTQGWDAELYRGDQYMASISNSDGTYKFDDVPLSGGVNVFKILKYGPQGEVDEEEITIYSQPHLRGIEGGLYGVSVVAAATDLWRRNPKESVDKYTPVVDADYQWGLNDTTSMKATLSTSQQQREQKTFPGIGIASYLYGTFLNANMTADVDGSYTASATARRSIYGQSVSAGATYAAEDYGSISGTEVPGKYSLSAAARGPLPYLPGTYALNTSYQEDEAGKVRMKNRVGLSTRAAGLGLSTSVEQDIAKTNGKSDETFNGSTFVTGNLWRANWRAGADYHIAPDGWSMEQYSLNVTRGIAKDISGYLELQNDPAADLTSGKAAVVWNGKYSRVTPSVSYDSANNLTALLTSNFGVSYDSYTKDIVVRGKDYSKYGGVSAFVYLDRDGDNTFSDGDDPIQDAIVQAVHSHTAGTTDEKGEAFLFDLPANLITDVRLDEFSFFDPYMVPGTEGVSVMPRPGRETRIEFPVHNGGEMDGSVFVQPKNGKARSLRNIHVYLYDMDGRLAKSALTSFDGFYLFQKIHPGKYYLVVDESDAKNFGLTRPLPETIAFGYEGTIIYKHDVMLGKAERDGPGDIPLNVGADYGGYASMNPSFDPAILNGKSIVLNLGSYRSNLLMSLVWYRLKQRYDAIVGDATLLVDPAESFASLETGLHTLRAKLPGYDMEDAWNRCRALSARGLYCGVEVLPQIPKGREATVYTGKG